MNKKIKIIQLNYKKKGATRYHNVTIIKLCNLAE
jgi:hypothetical protein